MDKYKKGVSKQVGLVYGISYPGNVRELKHVIESAFNFVGEPDEEQLPVI